MSTSASVFGNAAHADETRGWFLGHFVPGAANPLRSEDLELKVSTVRWPSVPPRKVE